MSSPSVVAGRDCSPPIHFQKAKPFPVGWCRHHLNRRRLRTLEGGPDGDDCEYQVTRQMERGDHRVAGALTRQREARVFPLPHAPAGIPITQRGDFHQRLRVFLCRLWTVSEPLLSVAISFLSPTKSLGLTCFYHAKAQRVNIFHHQVLYEKVCETTSYCGIRKGNC